MSELKLTIDGDDFDKATQRIACARALLIAFGIFMIDSAEDGYGSVSGRVMNDCMLGISFLLDDATASLDIHTTNSTQEAA